MEYMCYKTYSLRKWIPFTHKYLGSIDTLTLLHTFLYNIIFIDLTILLSLFIMKIIYVKFLKNKHH